MEVQIESGCAEDERPLARVVLTDHELALLRSRRLGRQGVIQLASGDLVFTVLGRQAYLGADNVLVLSGVSTHEEAATIIRALVE